MKATSLITTGVRKNFIKTPQLYAISNTKRSIQEETLTKLLSQAKNTEFGMIHDFRSIQKSADPIALFKEKVPLTSYSAFHDEWIVRALKGESNVIWPGKINYFALSSGTTKGGSKFIPVSDQMLKQFKKTSFVQASEVSSMLKKSTLLKSKALIVGGSTSLRFIEDVRVGDLSGILAKNKSWVFSSFSKPGKKISQISDWEEKMNRIVERAEKWNIGVIAGVPSWISMLLERIIIRYQLNSIHDIWPNLQLYVHGGVFLDPYKSKIDKMCRRPLLYQNTYLASEGYFGYQREFNTSNMELLMKHGVFYEFVDASQFEALRCKMFNTIKTLTVEEIEPEKPYAVVISTCSGLWRYNLGDVIMFHGAHKKNFKIVGRISYNLNICGEHLSEENLSVAITDTGRRFGIEIHEFCSYPSIKNNRHQWYIGVDHSVSENEFEAYLDERLKQLNDDYWTARKFLLKKPKVKVLPVEKFYEFMSIHNKIGSQSKFPRVMTEKLVKCWEAFLSNSEGYIYNPENLDA